MRKLTLYRDDSTTQVVFENVKHWFWTAGNTVLTIAGWCRHCGCGNDVLGYKHLPNCKHAAPPQRKEQT